MSDPALITVGVPTYNRAASLRRTLRSLMDQDYPSLEIIVGDNASTDATDAVRQQVEQDPRVTWHRRDVNVGPVRNFELLLEEAHGVYFMWLADDDVISPNYLSACISALSNDPLAVRAVGKTIYVRDDEIVRQEEHSYDELSPSARVRSYYRTVEGNPFWYGVTRTQQARACLPIGPSGVGMDWIHVARHLFSGKAILVKEATFRVSLYFAGDPKKGDHSLGEGWGRQAFKMYFIPRDAVRDVLNHPAYADMARPRRFTFALVVGLVAGTRLTTRHNVFRAGALVLRRLLSRRCYFYLRNRWRSVASRITGR